MSTNESTLSSAPDRPRRRLRKDGGARAASWPVPSGFRLRRALAVPVFHKILLAGAAIVFLTALASALLAVRLLGDTPTGADALLLLAAPLLGAAVAVPLQALVLRLALRPIGEIAEAAERIDAGDSTARAPVSPLADPRIERLARVFNRALDRMAADRARLQAIAERAINAQEAERLRLARELNAGIAQSLATLLLQLRAARSVGEPRRCDELLDELRAQLVETTELVRQYARGLHPPSLHELGIVPALEALARTLSAQHGVHIEVLGDGVRAMLAPEAEVGLYRIVQEALANSLRHAHAARACVHVAAEREEVVVRVEDDGGGFDVSQVLGSGGALGLWGMQERALYLGGAVEIRSAPGKGTRVEVRVPAPARPRAVAAGV